MIRRMIFWLFGVLEPAPWQIEEPSLKMPAARPKWEHMWAGDESHDRTD